MALKSQRLSELFRSMGYKEPTASVTNDEQPKEVAVGIGADTDGTNDTDETVVSEEVNLPKVDTNTPDDVKENVQQLMANSAQQQEDHYQRGYDMTDAIEKQNIRNRMNNQRTNITQFVNDDVVNRIDDDDDDVLGEIETYNWSDDEKKKVRDYVNSRRAYNGMIARVQDDINDAVAASYDAISQRVSAADNGGDGMIHPATMAVDDRQVDIISGNVVMTDDGTMIDHTKSDKDIIVRDRNTGKVEYVNINALKGVDAAIDPEQLKASEAERIEQEMAAAASREIDGTLDFNVGDVYTLADDNGEVRDIHILQDNQDGNVTVSIDGVQAVMPKDEMQQMADKTNMSRVIDAEEQQSPVDVAAQKGKKDGEMPMTENGEPDFTATTPERGRKYLYEESGLDTEEADKIAQNNRKAAEKELKELKDKKPEPSTDVAKYRSEKEEYNRMVEDAQKKVDYWENILNNSDMPNVGASIMRSQMTAMDKKFESYVNERQEYYKAHGSDDPNNTPISRIIPDLLFSGSAETPEEALQIAKNLMWRNADISSREIVGNLVMSLPNDAHNRGEDINRLWYNEKVQDEVMRRAHELGLDYNTYVKGAVIPAFRSELMHRFHISESDARAWSSYIFSDPKVVRNEVYQQEANAIVTPYVQEFVKDAFSQVDYEVQEMWKNLNKSKEQMPQHASATGISSTMGADILGLMREQQITDPQRVWDELLEPRMDGIVASIVNNKQLMSSLIGQIEKEGISPEDYIMNRIYPVIETMVYKEWYKTGVSREMPTDFATYLQKRLKESMVGLLIDSMVNSKTRRAMAQEAMMKTDAGEGSYNPSTGTKIAGEAFPIMVDAPLFGVAGKATAPVAKATVNGLMGNYVDRLIGRVVGASIGSGYTIGGAEFIKGMYRGGMESDSDNIFGVISDAMGSGVESGIGGFKTGLAFFGRPIAQSIINGTGAVRTALGLLSATMVNSVAATAAEAGEEYITNGRVDVDKLPTSFTHNVMLFGVLEGRSLAKEVYHTAKGERFINNVRFSKEEAERLGSIEGAKNLRDLSQKIEKERREGNVEDYAETARGQRRRTRRQRELTPEEREQLNQAGAKFYESVMNDKEIPFETKLKVAQALQLPLTQESTAPEERFDDIEERDGKFVLTSRNMFGMKMAEQTFGTREEAEQKRDEVEKQWMDEAKDGSSRMENIVASGKVYTDLADRMNEELNSGIVEKAQRRKALEQKAERSKKNKGIGLTRAERRELESLKPTNHERELLWIYDHNTAYEEIAKKMQRGEELTDDERMLALEMRSHVEKVASDYVNKEIKRMRDEFGVDDNDVDSLRDYIDWGTEEIERIAKEERERNPEPVERKEEVRTEEQKPIEETEEKPVEEVVEEETIEPKEETVERREDDTTPDYSKVVGDDGVIREVTLKDGRKGYFVLRQGERIGDKYKIVDIDGNEMGEVTQSDIADFREITPAETPTEAKVETKVEEKEEQPTEEIKQETYEDLFKQFVDEQESVNREGGLVRDEVSERALPSSWAGTLHRVGRDIGKRFVVVTNEEVEREWGKPEKEGDIIDGWTTGNTIYLNEKSISRGDYFRSLISGHELTHILKKMSPELWESYVKSVKDAMGDEYQKVFDRKRKVYDAWYKKQNRERAEDAEIDEEIVCDWAGKNVLTNADEARRIVESAEAVGEDPVKVIKNVLDWLKDTVGKLRQALAGGEDVNEQLAAYEQAQKLWEGMYQTAVAKRNAEKRQAETATTGEIEGGGKPRMSISSIFEGAGFKAGEMDDDGNLTPRTDKEGNVVITLDGREYSAKNPVTVKDLDTPNSPLSVITDFALEYGTADRKKVKRIKKTYADIINMFLNAGSAENGGTEGLQEQWLWLGESVFRTIATNGDKQYSYSADITRVCKKNEAVIRAISALQKEQGYGATPAQIMDIYASTYDYGYQVPCPVCYVFSRYLRNGKYASAAINGMLKYGEHLPNGKDPWTVEQWQDELNRLEDEKKDKKIENTLKKANEDITKLFKAIDDRGLKLLDPKTSEVEKKRLREEIVALDAQYRAAIDVINQQSLTNWIKSFAIKEEKGVVSIRPDAKLPENMEEFKENALDIRKVAETMRLYPAIQRLRKSGGAAAGKEITFASNNEFGEVISGVGTSNPSESINWYREISKAETDEEREQAMTKARKRFGDAVLYAARQSLRGGQRMWSWSDNIENLSPDVVINLMQMELLGGALQSYSKQLEGVALVATLDGYVNGSLMAKDNGWREVKAEDTEVRDGKRVLKNAITETIEEPVKGGEKRHRTRVLADAGSPIYEQDGKSYVLIFDDVIGIDPHGREEDGKHKKGLFDLNKELSRAGNILVGMNDLHVRAALADDRIYFIIPWHASGQSVHILKAMLDILGTDLRQFKPIDYTNMQEEKDLGAKKKDGTMPKVSKDVVDIWESHKNEKWKSGIGTIESGDGKGGLSEGQRSYRELRKKIFDGSIDSDPEALKQVKADEFLSQVYRKVKERAGTMTSTDNEFIYPYEYWDETSTLDTADINGARYLEYCRRLGVRPKFCGKWDKGKRSMEGNFIDDKGFWKLLIDRRMYDVDGKFQDLTPVDTERFTPDLVDPKKTKEKYVSTEVADDEGTQKIVDSVIKQETERANLAGKGLPTANYDMSMREAVEAYGNARSGIKFRIEDEENLTDEVELADTRFRVESLGAPYQGSKGKIAKRLMESLPSGKRFVDLFSGGGAMTHAAMLSGKYDTYAMNDTNPVGQELFMRGMRGEYDDYNWKDMTDEDFKKLKGTPEALMLSYSGLGRNLAKDGGVKAGQQIRRVQRLSALKPYADKVEASSNDYREVDIKEGDVVYADIPYENTNQAGYGQGKFDKKAFVDWAQEQDFPVYVSEYTMPEGWTEIDSIDVVNIKKQRKQEKLWVQDKFAETYSTPEEAEEAQTKFRVVDDPEEIERLEKGEKETGYRNVVLNDDGSFGSPMANTLGNTGKKAEKTNTFMENKWEVADERPWLADENGKINLGKPDGLGSVQKVDYNPYVHIRPNKVNTQFKNAWERRNLVYIEVKYPASELTSGYHAEKAKLSVGKHPWNGGELILSRYNKPVGVCSWEEVADDWEKELKGKGAHFDIVPPMLLPILQERGFKILPPHKNMSKECNDAYKAWKSGDMEGYEAAIRASERKRGIKSEDNTRFRITPEEDAEYMDAVEKRDTKKAQQIIKAAVKRAMPETKVVDEDGNPKVVYHGTDLEEVNGGEPFYTFYDDSHFGTWGQAEGRLYGRNAYFIRKNPKIYEVYLNLKNPKRVPDVPIDWEGTHADYWAQAIEQAKEEGYDGIVYKNEWEGEGDSYIAFNPDQIKSADPITYDNNGKVIPLSERFNKENDDIRFRVSDERRRREYAERQWKRAHNKAANTIKSLGISDNVTIVDTPDELADYDAMSDRQKASKGWYDEKTGNIVIVMGNHTSPNDVLQTILREGVGRYGMRKLFGQNYNNFLDNVLTNAASDVRKGIVNIATRNGWDFRKATEEYLASLATDSNFEKAMEQNWWSDIKQMFLDMMRSIGLADWAETTITDNELRYMLWRSYENLVEPDRYRNPFNRAKEISMRDNLKVGDYRYIEDELPVEYNYAAEQRIRQRVSEMPMSEVRKAYQRINDKMRDEDGLDIDEHMAKVREDWRNENGDKGIGKVMAEDVQSLRDKYGDNLLSLRNYLLDRIEKEDNTRFRIDDEEDTEDTENNEGAADEPLDEEYDAGKNTLADSTLNALATLAEKNKKDVELRKNALHQIGTMLMDLCKEMQERPYDNWDDSRKVSMGVRQAASKQRKFDKETVDGIVRLARTIIRSGLFKGFSPYEVNRLMSLVRNAAGRKDITKQAEKVVDILLDRQIKEMQAMLKKQMSVRGSKLNQKGVEVQGVLDIRGQRVLDAFKKGMDRTEEDLDNRINEVAERMNDANESIAENAKAEWEGLQMAKSYLDGVTKSKAEEAELRQELKDAEEEMKAGRMSREAYKEFVKTTNDALRENKLERIKAYEDVINTLTGGLRESVAKAKEWKEKELQRVQEIHHNANSDLEGVEPLGQQDIKIGWFENAVKNNPITRILFAPAATFDYLLRFFGGKHVDGKGYLWNRFMSQFTKASDSEWRNKYAAHQTLDEKVSEVFGKKMRWSDLFGIVRKMPTVKVSFWDAGEMREHELTQGNLLYIYAANKMTDGKMKLRKMGITEEDVANIEAQLDPRLKELIDWVQSDFLVKKREDYNKVHERMFGAPMAAIDNYFPLKISDRSLDKTIDIGETHGDTDKPSTVVGSVIKRVRNTKPLDVLNTDAFDVVLSHVDEMEHWAAFAEFCRDLNTLLSYKNFRNKVENMKSMRFGTGKELFDTFRDAAAIAAGAYSPKRGKIDKWLVNIAKGVTASKIALRIYTAFKQLTSYPAYFAEANIVELAKSSNPYGMFKSWKWAMKNLPLYSKRWQSRQAGDQRLKETDVDWKVWKNNFVEKLGRLGMSANAFVDALTVAMGAKAIYETKKSRYLKDGYSAEKAEELALRDASIAYNETQQSSEDAFLSAIQLDRTFSSVALTVFRNASMGYQRRYLQAIGNMKRRIRKGYKEESIEFMKKQAMRDGLTEEQAERVAKRAYNRSLYKDLANIAIFGYVMQLTWNLAPYAPYLLMGDDDDEKKAMWEDAFRHAMFGGLEGLAGGNIYSDIGNMLAEKKDEFGDLAQDPSWDKVKEIGKDVANYNFTLMPLSSDMQNVIKHLGTDPVSAVDETASLLIQSSIGTNPKTFTDAVVAIVDACDGDPKTSREAALLIMRILQVPQPTLDKLYIDELGMSGKEARQLSVEDLAKRYAHYKMNKNAPLVGQLAGEEYNKKVEEKYMKVFEEKVAKRFDKMSDKELIENFNNAQPKDKTGKKKMSKEIAKRLEGKDSYGSPSTAYGKIYLEYRDYDDIVEDMLLQRAEKDAKDDGFPEKAKDIARVRREITKLRKELTEVPYTLEDGTKITADSIMNDIRRMRRQALEDFDIEKSNK